MWWVFVTTYDCANLRWCLLKSDKDTSTQTKVWGDDLNPQYNLLTNEYLVTQQKWRCCQYEEFFRPSTGIPVLHSGSHFRHGLLQLMIHTIDPLHDGRPFAAALS